MIDSFWFSPVRMIQPNLRMVDAKGMDGRRLAREIRSYGANSILANGGGIVAWYPTQLPYHWRNPILRRDFVGELTQEAARLSMRVLLRFDFSCLVPSIGKRHRDWLALDRDGNPAWEWRGTRNPLMHTCPLRPYWTEYGPRELEETMVRYRVDGFFFNAWNLPLCYCPECQADTKKALGVRIPRKFDWDSKFGRDFLLHRLTRHAEFTKRLNERIKRTSPGTLLTVDYHLTNDNPHHLGRAAWDGALLTDAVDMVTVEAFNFLDRPHPQWRHWAPEEVKIIRSFPAGKPGIVLLTGSERWIGRRPAGPPQQMEENIRQIVENGGNPCIALSGDLRQEDPRVLPVVRKAFRELERRGGVPRRTAPPARVAIVYSQRTFDIYGASASRERALFEYRGWYSALDESRVPFTVVHGGVLREFLASARGISHLVLPNCACLSDSDCRAVDEWVRAGGHLAATFETSLFDERGRRRKGFGIASPGRIPGKAIRFPGTWFKAEGARKWANRHSGIFPVSGDFLLTRGGGKGFLRLLGWSFANKPEWSQPESVTNQHGIYERKVGRGKCVYLPWMPGKLYHLCLSPEHRDLMVKSVSF